jgi:hypothetical protein
VTGCLFTRLALTALETRFHPMLCTLSVALPEPVTNYRGKAEVNVTTGLFFETASPPVRQAGPLPLEPSKLNYESQNHFSSIFTMTKVRILLMTSVNLNRRVACLCSLRSTRLIVMALKLTLTAQHCLWRMLHSPRKLGLRPCSNGRWCAADHFSSLPIVAVADGGS